MWIRLGLTEDPGAFVRLLNFLARENEDLISRNPATPLLYTGAASGQPIVRYAREKQEQWLDVFMMIRQGWEDCDGLSCYRAGELRARGWRAIEPGYSSYRLAESIRPDHIPAKVFLRTRGNRTFHCLVSYELDGHTFFDDPSARLGMYGGRLLSPAWVERRLDEQLRAREAQIHLTPAWDARVGNDRHAREIRGYGHAGAVRGHLVRAGQGSVEGRGAVRLVRDFKGGVFDEQIS